MKSKSILLLCIVSFIAVSYNAEVRSGTEKQIQPLTSHVDYNPMNAKIALTLAFSLLLIFGFQSAIGQDEISIAAQNWIEQIVKIQKDVEKGKSFNQGAPEMQWIDRATTIAERDRFYSRTEPNDGEKKKLNEALDALAKLISEKGGAVNEEVPLAVKFLLDEISKVKQQVDDFDPRTKLFMVNMSEGEWLLRAISMREREKWATGFFKSNASGKKEFWKKLDELAASGAQKIPSFKPNPKNFSTHSSMDEALMKKKLDDVSKIKIHQIGLAQKDWDIQKNELDVPQKRFKAGYIWGKDSRDDFNYCRLYQINIIQNYEGGGRYGESYAVPLTSWIVGCP